MTDNRKDKNQDPSKQHHELEDPLKKGMHASGGKMLRGVGMEASAQQSGRGMGESSAERNWDAGPQQAGGDRGEISTGLDTSGNVAGRNEREQQQQTASGLGAQYSGTAQGQGSGVKSQGLGSGSTGLDTATSQQNIGGARSEQQNQAGARSPQKQQDEQLHSSRNQSGPGNRDDNR